MLLYAIAAGLLLPVPSVGFLGEGIRNLFYHVGMWFAMMAMLALSVAYSIGVLRTDSAVRDAGALAAADTGLLFGFAGIVTGMIWAGASWGAIWINDPKLNGAALGMIIYLAYKLLRASVPNPVKRARVAAVYNIFAFTFYVVFVFVLPRLAGQSIHPSPGGGMVMIPSNLDPQLRIIFYPALAGWILLSIWIFSLWFRYKKLLI